MYDVVIVGGGPTGLSAALILGRYRRSVLVLDSGTPRNAATPHTWGLFTRDGTAPEALREQARADLTRYPTVECRAAEVTRVRREAETFAVDLADGGTERACRLILATGLRQPPPGIEGFEAYWGHGVHTCPYCDGYESRDRPLVAYGAGHAGLGLALELTARSRDVTLCTNGRPESLSVPDRARLARNGIAVEDGPVVRLTGDGDRAERLSSSRTESRGPAAPSSSRRGTVTPRPSSPNSGATFPRRTPCRLETTRRPTSPASTSRRVQFAVVAAAEGAMAAFAINTELLKAGTA